MPQAADNASTLEQQLAQLDPADPSPRATWVEKKLRHLHLAEDLHPSTTGGTVEPRPPRLDEIQQLLDFSTTLLVYALGERASHVWRVSRNGLSSHVLAGRAVLEDAARRTYAQLTTNSRGEEARRQRDQQLADLARRLMPPALAAEMTTERVVLVLDGALHFVPFAALPRPVGHPQWIAGRDTPLVTAHEVLRVPSAGILRRLRVARRWQALGDPKLAVFADATYQASPSRRLDPGLGGPEAAVEKPGARVDEEAVLGLYSPLPATREEGEAIVRLAPGRPRAFFGADASRETAFAGDGGLRLPALRASWLQQPGPTRAIGPGPIAFRPPRVAGRESAQRA